PQNANGWQRMRGPAESALAGGLWCAWPCGLLQSALVIAALADDAPGGAFVMAAFAIASGAGLALAPWLWQRLGGHAAAAGAPWAARAAGALLAAASGWALFHGLWMRVAAYCFG
ncbi:MAG: sulfite exporter TauE/SafE family protein, partial [Burkholderiales bacterium]|nr:sulfite exporter TauE/SafE family protein [Burkholderiales bacterium]